MTISMFQASVPVLTQSLNATIVILDKAIAHCAAKKIDPSVLVNFRLAPDMLPFKAQIYIMTDQAKGCVARLAGVDVPSYPDTETTLEDLKARVQKTLEFVQTFKPSQIDGSEERDITLKFGPNEFKFKGQGYLLNMIFPNLFFHQTFAYAILRHNGVEVGKKDFLGS